MRPRSDTLFVWTGAPCSYGCATCPIDPAAAPAGVEISTLGRILSGLSRDSGRLVVLVGGEPFLRKDLTRLLLSIVAVGARPGIVTSGRSLLYPKVRETLRRIGLSYLRVQLFGVAAEHDRSTGVAGSYRQALDGLKAWLAEDIDGTCDVDVAFNVRGRSTAALTDELAMLAEDLSGPQLQLIVSSDQPETLGDVELGMARWNDNPERPLLAWENIAGTTPGFSTRAPAISGFASLATCLGSGHRHGPASVEEVRANSFNYIRSGEQIPYAADPAECRAHLTPPPRGSERELWLIEDGRLVRYVSDTGDFSSAEIARVKDEWSHLFLDRAEAGRLDDFVEGMRRILPDVACERCGHRPHCGRRYRVVDGAPFAREEAWVADAISALRGRVLDVGCGEQLYRDRLAPLLRSGAAIYTGLDPDELSLRHAQQALPEGRFVLGDIEHFEAPPASYDHILCLRALNHVLSLDDAIARMSAMLTPGGSLLLVECTPFALLRQSDQVRAADRAERAGHQHFRNLAGEELFPFLRRHGLRVLDHIAQGLEGTNQWVIRAQRPAPALRQVRL